MIIQNSNLFALLNSDIVNGLANASQFYNIYQSTKAGTYAQLNNELQNQTRELESKLDSQTAEILNKTLELLQTNIKQNEFIISQNEEILKLLGGKNVNK